MAELSDRPAMKKPGRWNRQLLQLGIAGAGVAGSAIALQNFTQKRSAVARVPPMSADAVAASNINPMQIARDFDYGTVTRENGRTVREFRMEANTSIVQLNSAVTFNTWNVNNQVPGQH